MSSVDAKLPLTALSGKLNKEYPHLCGKEQFRELAKTFVLGPESPSVKEDRVWSIQSYGGGGALTLAAGYLFHKLKYQTIYIPEQTWENHGRIFKVELEKFLGKHEIYFSLTSIFLAPSASATRISGPTTTLTPWPALSSRTR